MRSRASILLISLVIALSTAPLGGSIARAQDGTGGFAHPEWFAQASWLQQQLGDDNLAIVALTPAADFAAGHVPGAAQVDWPAFEIVETSDAALLTWRDEVEALLTQLGIERDDTVVVYDGGTFYAGRLWWILYQLGHDDVRVLNGGLQAWVGGGGELETGAGEVEPAAAAYVGQPRAEALVPIAAAVAALEDKDATFVDARRFEDEYVVGHIPGAINVPFLDNAEPADPKYWKPAAELRAMYEQKGVTADQRIIVYCATGVRSAVTYFTLRQLGYEDVGLFTGSFVEWSNDPSLPVTTGTAP